MNSDPSRISTLGTEIDDRELPVIPPEHQFIQLSIQTGAPLLLSVLSLIEILTIETSQVVPMFQLPPWVMGVYNWRGSMLWIADLNHLMGLPPWYQQSGYGSKHTVVVLRESAQQTAASENRVLGLVINQVHDMVVCDPALIHTLESLEIPAEMMSFLAGHWQGQGGETQWILSGAKIFQAMTA